MDDSKAREWYHNEAFQQTWSFRTLQRNINTQYYFRLLQSQDKNAVEQEMKDKTLDSILHGNEQLFASKLLVIISVYRERLKVDSCTAMETKNEVRDTILKMGKKNGRLNLPLVHGKYLRKVKNGAALQNIDYAVNFSIGTV